MAMEMVQLAKAQPGFLGLEAAFSPPGSGGANISVSYWRDEASIAAWRAQARHRVAQQRGRARWYASFHTRVAKVERAYSFTRPADAADDDDV